MTTEQNIHGHAMLVNAALSAWTGRKHDRDVTHRVNDEYAAGAEAGRYHKHLFGGPILELTAVFSAYRHVKVVHFANTLPWADDGWRILPTANYYEYRTALRAAREKFEAAVDTFVQAYPRLREEARQRLNGMYRVTDYPAPQEVQSRFRVDVQFAPLPHGSDFRIQLPAAEMQAVADDVNARISTIIESAMREAWERLGDAIVGVRKHLTDGKHLRSSVVEKLGQVAETLGRLNLTHDVELESMRQRVLSEVASYDAETLRKDGRVRAQAASAADDILARMQAVYTPPAPEEDA